MSDEKAGLVKSTETQSAQPQSALTKFRNLLSQETIKAKFHEALGKKAPLFMSNLTTILSGSDELQKCEHMSIISSALMAASMDLTLTPGLGFAGIVPYWDSKSGTMKAQFQVMKKGYIQLAQRTGLFKIINVSEVYEGELKSYNRFTGEYVFDETERKSENIVGYVSYFRLINGFEKYFYMPIEKLDKHAKKYSKSFQKGKGKWADKEEGGYEQMCEKTVLKLNLATYAPLSVDINMMNAIVYDQAEIRDMDARDYDYIDNEDSHKPEQKEVLEIGGGKTVVINKDAEEKAKQVTTRAIDKIEAKNFAPVKEVVHNVEGIYDKNVELAKESMNKQRRENNLSFNPEVKSIGYKNDKPPIFENYSVTHENNNESPFKPERGSVEMFDGKITKIDGKKLSPEAQEERKDAGEWTVEAMRDMDTEALLEKINTKSEMIEAMVAIPGKNTNKKLREIIDAWQRGKLDMLTAPFKGKDVVDITSDPGIQNEQKEAENEPSPAMNQGIQPNRDFDKQTSDPELKLETPKSTELNKYGLLIPEWDKGNEREFSTTKRLYNDLLTVNPKIDNERWLELRLSVPALDKYKNKEEFLKYATVKEICNLLNAN